jgi:hypothetical protein
MTRWLILVAVVAANLLGVSAALLPTLVTWAEIAPIGISCATCSSPEVQAALTRAASAGRGQIVAFIHSYSWVVIAVALLNVTVAAALFWAWHPNRQ